MAERRLESAETGHTSRAVRWLVELVFRPEITCFAPVPILGYLCQRLVCGFSGKLTFLLSEFCEFAHVLFANCN